MPSVYARVKLELEIRVNSTWSEDTTMAQIKKQAIEDAKGIIRNTMDKEGCRTTLLAEPIFTAILACNEK